MASVQLTLRSLRVAGTPRTSTSRDADVLVPLMLSRALILTLTLTLNLSWTVFLTRQLTHTCAASGWTGTTPDGHAAAPRPLAAQRAGTGAGGRRARGASQGSGTGSLSGGGRRRTPRCPRGWGSRRRHLRCGTLSKGAGRCDWRQRDALRLPSQPSKHNSAFWRLAV